MWTGLRRKARTFSRIHIGEPDVIYVPTQISDLRPAGTPAFDEIREQPLQQAQTSSGTAGLVSDSVAPSYNSLGEGPRATPIASALPKRP